LFQIVIACPILLLWTRFVLGAKVYGRKISVASKVGYGMQPCPPAGQRFNWRNVFPRRVVFPTLTQNVKTLWPGKLVRILGGFAIPDNIMELKAFLTRWSFF